LGFGAAAFVRREFTFGKLRLHIGEAGLRELKSAVADEGWWAWVDLNNRPHPYQGCALAT
jgi:hypothetical protein